MLGAGGQCNAREWVPGKERAKGNRTCWITPSHKLQSPMLCPETESNKLCKIKKLGLFKATPGILSVSLKGGLPIKFWTAPRAATGRTRAGQADRYHPGSGTSPGLSAALQPRHFLLASAPSIPISIRAIDTLSRRVLLALLVNSCKTSEPWARTSEGTAKQGNAQDIYIYKYLTSFHCLHEQRPGAEDPELRAGLWRESCRGWDGEWNSWKLPSCPFGLSL